MDIKALLVKLLPLFYKLTTQIWYQLSPKQRSAATQAVNVVNWIKQFIQKNDIPSMIEQAKSNFNLPADVLKTDKLREIQAKLKAGVSDIEYNQIWKTLSEQIAADITPEPFDWKQFALGIMQIAFEEIVKK